MDRSQAANLVNTFHIPIEKDFFVLSPGEVCRVLNAADTYKYRKPKQANGSRGRYFFYLLQRSLGKE